MSKKLRALGGAAMVGLMLAGCGMNGEITKPVTSFIAENAKGDSCDPKKLKEFVSPDLAQLDLACEKPAPTETPKCEVTKSDKKSATVRCTTDKKKEDFTVNKFEDKWLIVSRADAK